VKQKLKCLKKCCYYPDDEQLANKDALILEWQLRVIVGHGKKWEGFPCRAPPLVFFSSL